MHHQNSLQKLDHHFRILIIKKKKNVNKYCRWEIFQNSNGLLDTPKIKTYN